jgi:hypothetical protein
LRSLGCFDLLLMPDSFFSCMPSISPDLLTFVTFH